MDTAATESNSSEIAVCRFSSCSGAACSNRSFRRSWKGLFLAVVPTLLTLLSENRRRWAESSAPFLACLSSLLTRYSGSRTGGKRRQKSSAKRYAPPSRKATEAGSSTETMTDVSKIWSQTRRRTLSVSPSLYCICASLLLVQRIISCHVPFNRRARHPLRVVLPASMPPHAPAPAGPHAELQPRLPRKRPRSIFLAR